MAFLKSLFFGVGIFLSPKDLFGSHVVGMGGVATPTVLIRLQLALDVAPNIAAPTANVSSA